MQCSITFHAVTDSQIKHVMFELFFVFKNTRFIFDISIIAGVERGGDIVQWKLLSVIPNCISAAFGLKDFSKDARVREEGGGVRD